MIFELSISPTKLRHKYSSIATFGSFHNDCLSTFQISPQKIHEVWLDTENFMSDGKFQLPQHL